MKMSYVPFLLVALLAAVAFADDAKYDMTWRYPEMSIPKLDAPPTIDGKVDDAFWQQATLFPAALSRDPLAGDGTPPDQRTWVWMAYTDDALYWAFRQDLPAYELPVKADNTKRDSAEGRDNTVNILFSVDPKKHWQQFNFSGNAASSLYDRRFDDGSSKYYNPDLTYQATKGDAGWEGEMKIPFAELGLTGAPADGAQWNMYFYSAWRKSGTRLFAWPYVRWRRQGETGTVTFGGADSPGVRFTDYHTVETAGDANVDAQLYYRPRGKGETNYHPALMSAMDIATGEAATLESFDSIIERILENYTTVSSADGVGEYLLRYEVTKDGKRIAAGTEAFAVNPPLDVKVTPFFLQAKKLGVSARTNLEAATRARFTIQPLGTSRTLDLDAGAVQTHFDTADMPVGDYELIGEALDASGEIISTTTIPFEKPAAPLWWTMEGATEPLVPKPWTPIEATSGKADVLLRTYAFHDEALPSQVTALGNDLLAGPMTLETDGGWGRKQVVLTETRPDAATYVGMLEKDGVRTVVRNQLEFDGYMLYDVELYGPGKLSQLDLVIPIKREHAILMQNYAPAPGPYAPHGRHHGFIPEEGYTSVPFITTWIGTDTYGLEFCTEDAAGWSMRKPDEAMAVTPRGDVVEFRVRFISKPVALDANEPRRIRFGLVATPTKTLLPYLQKTRFNDDAMVQLLPGDWSGDPYVWHPPVTDPELIAEKKQWVDAYHARGEKLLVNGGWAVSVQDPDNAPWIHEMFGQPMSNVSFSIAKQYAYCYDTPYAQFLANSFHYNARVLGFDGIRFDTVTPGYTCNSLIHPHCGWHDDNGQLHASFSIFAQREVWKRLYRTFHGAVKDEGIVYTPNASGPIMAIHSFSDHHEIGEGFYQKAANLKVGYPPDMVRAIMTGRQYGFVTAANLKMGPLFNNERIAALLVNDAEPRFLYSNNWKNGYHAHGNPAASIWDAWDWVDRYVADFRGWWDNADTVAVDKGDNEIYASVYANVPAKRALLVVTNYELHPLQDLPVTLNLDSLGLSGGDVYAEDAITGAPVDISSDGKLALDIFRQRYRLIQISHDKPRFGEDNLGENLIEAGGEPVSETWHGSYVQLEPNSEYVLTAEVRIDDVVGAKSDTPNYMGKFSPAIRHTVGIGLQASDVTGIMGGKRLGGGGEPYHQTDHYRRGYTPQWWEPTGGWTTMHLPIQTGDKTDKGRFVVSITDAGEAQVRNMTLRKVK